MNRERTTTRTAMRTGAALLAAAVLLSPMVTAQAVTGPAETDATRGFTARLDIGNGARACTAALVHPQWLLTAASCFADDPAAPTGVPAGAPRQATKAVIGRTDLTTTLGAERTVVQLLPRDDRDVVLARLSAPVTDIQPATLATAPAAADEKLTLTGYGRTTDEWAPVKAHHGTFTVTGTEDLDVGLHGNGSAVCAGDAGAPLFRPMQGAAQIVALATGSDQGGCFGSDAAQTSTAAVGARTDGLADWVKDAVDDAQRRAPVADFNGDGFEDTAIGDPKATVAGYAEAGAVHVVYGGGRGTTQVDQSASYIPAGAEPGDRFGHALATVDYNKDGFTDLVVGAPYEDTTATVTDVGTVAVVYGSAAGLGKGRVSDTYVQGDGVMRAAVKQKGDLLGSSLAAGHTRDGSPYLVIGSAGDTVGGQANAGTVFYLRGATCVSIAQGAGMSGGPEPGDKVGASVAGGADHIAIGAPGEDIDAVADGGAAWVFTHPAQAGARPVERANINQNLDTVSGGAEAGDVFGAAVALVEDGPGGQSVLAAGVPGESLTADNGAVVNNAGGVATFNIPATGAWSERRVFTQNSAGIADRIEAGDRFGETLQAINLSPHTTPTWESLQLVAGAPGESQGSAAGAGAVHVVTLYGDPGLHNDVLLPGTNLIPGAPGAGQRVGQAIGVSPTHIYVGMPTGQGAVHAVPWQNSTSHSSTGPDLPVATYRPGSNGIPAGGKAFGSTIR
ncbi:trypsin-like serine protease [Streptomyces sp. KL118A]|uniref:trypsin-like serine protease n=1 Tax=Streptomyces sp. KL118A TaxID=3045153 RepID=UPI00278BE5C3|nr:trypsin-like serine protease [Streptomyces sp. KL118A]